MSAEVDAEVVGAELDGAGVPRLDGQSASMARFDDSHSLPPSSR